MFIIILTESKRSNDCINGAQETMFSTHLALELKWFCTVASLSLPADVSASAVGGLQGHADGLRLLQHLQHHGVPDRLRDTVPGGELQLQDGPHAR